MTDSKESSSSAVTCPLCFEDKIIEINAVPTEPIASYWSAMGYDVFEEFPEWPSFLNELRCVECGLHFFSPLLVGEARLYKIIATMPEYYATHKWEFSRTLSHLARRKFGNLLELGCGEGEFLAQAQRFVGNVSGIDVNGDAVRRCRSKGLQVSNASLSDISGKFDVIVAFQTFEHLASPGRVLSECLNKLSSDGELIISVPNQDGPLGEIENDFLNLPPHHVSRWERCCFEVIAKNHRLEILLYDTEPLSISLYQVLIENRFSRLVMPGGFRSSVIKRAAGIFLRALMPFSFDSARRKWPGHSHLAVFRKKAQSNSG